jgi:hypothetical protein
MKSSLELDPQVNKALRDEIGERLRLVLSADPNALPGRVRDLVARLRQTEREERFATRLTFRPFVTALLGRGTFRRKGPPT